MRSFFRWSCGALAASTPANFNLRPQMLGYLFLVLTLIALERFRQGRLRMLWFLPMLFLLWVNTHASWEIGLSTIFVYWMSGLKEIRLGGIEMRGWKPAERLRLARCSFSAWLFFQSRLMGPDSRPSHFNLFPRIPTFWRTLSNGNPCHSTSWEGNYFWGYFSGF